MKLLNTVKQLVLEGVSVQTLTDAIRKKQVVVIYYDGDEPGGRGLREIWPVCLGLFKSK
jgi:predicted DNA-binding transcriptional regulator YafY